jgi:hypothetical protein
MFLQKVSFLEKDIAMMGTINLLKSSFFGEERSTTIPTYDWLLPMVFSRRSPDFFHFFRSMTSNIFKTIWLQDSFMMMRRMFSAIGNHKIFYAIVGFDTIDVMHNFSFIKRTFEIGAHHKAMLPNISRLVCIGMSRRKNESISLTYTNASIPVKIKFSSELVPSNKYRETLNFVFISLSKSTATASAWVRHFLEARPFSNHGYIMAQHTPIWQ